MICIFTNNLFVNPIVSSKITSIKLNREIQVEKMYMIQTIDNNKQRERFVLKKQGEAAIQTFSKVRQLMPTFHNYPNMHRTNKAYIRHSLLLKEHDLVATIPHIYE